jgi:hypothetical protein
MSIARPGGNVTGSSASFIQIVPQAAEHALVAKPVDY